MFMLRDCDVKIKQSISFTNVTFEKLNIMLTNKKIPMETRPRMLKCYTKATLQELNAGRNPEKGNRHDISRSVTNYHRCIHKGTLQKMGVETSMLKITRQRQHEFLNSETLMLRMKVKVERSQRK